MCMVVITSRPTASLLLRQLVDQRIEILGLAKKEQEQYISESLKGSPEMITKLQQHLKQQPIINSLLYVPLHLAILLYLFKQDSLPETLTELNEYFIIHTIYRHLTKQRQLSFMKIDKITDLPEPELTIVYQLSKLAYKGLCNSQLVFTYDDIKEVCPKVDDTPGAISGFGLLQTVACYYWKGAGKFLSLNFLHFTMQEYLAAVHVSTLPSEEQSSLIENIFWDGKFNFMWIMYVGIVGPYLISHMVSESLYKGNYEYALHQDQYNVPARKSLFIFQCCLEAKKFKLITKIIKNIFSDGNIYLSKVTLLPHHIMSLTVFMMRSTTQWKSLNLDSCSIGNNGMSILAKFLVDFTQTTNSIKYLNLRNNRLTSLWGTYSVTDQNCANNSSDLLQSVEDLDISFNLLCDREILPISDCLKINSSLCKLNLSKNNIADEGAEMLAEAIQVNTILQELNISKNEITDDGAKMLSEAIQVNTALRVLNVSKNWISKEGVMRIVEACIINRTLHKLVCTHNNLTKSGLAAINEYIRKENAVQLFYSSWNIIVTKGNGLAFETIFQLTDMQWKLQLVGNDYLDELWFPDDITELRYRREFLKCCIAESEHVNVQNANLSSVSQIIIINDGLRLNKNITEVNLCNCGITNEGIKVLVQAVEVSTLQILDVSNNAISSDGALCISDFLKINSALCKLNLSGNKIEDEGTKELSEAIQVNTTLQDLNMSKNNITDEGANKLSKAIQLNTMLQELNISKNWISKEGVMSIVEACTINRTLHKLVCTHNNLSKSGLAAINEYIRKENAVQIFDASWNTISAEDGKLAIKTIFQLLDISKATFQLSGVRRQKLQSGNDTQEELWYVDEINELKYRREFVQCCIKESDCLNLQNANLSDMFQIGIISDCLKLSKKIAEVNLCGCQVTNERMKVFIQAIEVTTTLQNLDVSDNAISVNGILSISDFLKINKTLCKLNLSGNEIRDEGTKKLSEAIQVNTTLQDLNMSQNEITDEGATRFAEVVKMNTTLQELNISKNWISKEGVMRIVEACTINRTLHKLVCTHNILSKSGLVAINEYIRKENAVQIFDASWNTIGSYDGRLVIKTIFELLDIIANLQLSGLPQLWYADEIIELKYRREFLQCCIEEIEYLNLQNVNLSDMFQIGIISDGLKLNKNITEVNLCNCRVTNKGMKILVQAVEISSTLQDLDISYNVVSDDGVLSITNFLMINHTLCKLNLSGIELRNEGTAKLSAAIQVNTILQVLSVSNNKITNDRVKIFAEAIEINTTLQELNISKNWISKEGVMRIVEACTKNRTLHKLVCTHNNLSKSGLAAINEYIRKENAVHIFDASWNTINSYDGRLVIKTIFELLDIRIANLQLSGLQQLWYADGIVELKYRREFLQCCIEESEYLDLQNVILSDLFQIGIISDGLKLNKNIVELNLCNCGVTNEVVKVLVQAVEVSTLQILDVSNNAISNDGVLSIGDFLKINSALTKLNLSGNEIRDEGTKELSEAIQVNTTLQDLNMSRNNITDEGANELSKAIQVNRTLRELNISKNWMSKEGVMRIVEACTINRTLHKLVCTHNNLSKSELAAINEYIRKENAIQLFDVSCNTIIGSDRCGSLIIATFWLLRWSLDGWEFISFNYHKQVYLIDNGVWNGNHNIQYYITGDSLMELYFPYHTVSSNFLVGIIQQIMEIDTLLKLTISDNGISDDEAIIFGECLKTNTTMIELNLPWNNITCKGANAIAEALMVNNRLQKLDISSSCEKKISDDGAIAFSECLKTNTTLMELDLSRNNITHKGANAIAEALMINNTLQKLNISFTRIFVDGTMVFSEHLKTITTLVELDMSHNGITHKGGSAIAEALIVNSTLQKLNILDNRLSDVGAIAFSECLKTNRTLIELDLSNNDITCKGANVIAEALVVNNRLRKLNVSNNLISNI